MNFEEPDGATPLEHEEKEGLKFKHITIRAQLDELEQANIASGLLWLSRNKSKDLLNEHFVCLLHKKLFGEVWKWAGSFRQTEKNIGIDPRQISVQLKLLLEDTQYWMDHSVFKPCELAVRFHHRLV